MPIEFRCPSCDRLLRVPDEAAGKSSRCPNCGGLSAVRGGETPASTGAQIDATGGAPHGSSPENSFAEVNPFRDETPASPAGSPSGQAIGGTALNPYQSPATAYAPIAKPKIAGEMQWTKLRFALTYERWWEVLSQQIVPCLLFGLMAIAVSVVIGMIVVGAYLGILVALQGGFQPPMENNLTTMAISTGLGLVIGIPLGSIGLIIGVLFALEVVRGSDSPYQVMFRFMPFWLRIMGVYTLFSLINTPLQFACATPALVLQGQGRVVEAGLASMTGNVVHFVISTIITLLFGLAPFFIVDRNERAIQAIKSSATYMRGNLLIGFAAYFLFIILYLATCFFVCGVFLMPSFAIYFTVVYLSVTGQWETRSAYGGPRV